GPCSTSRVTGWARSTPLVAWSSAGGSTSFPGFSARIRTVRVEICCPRGPPPPKRMLLWTPRLVPMVSTVGVSGSWRDEPAGASTARTVRTNTSSVPTSERSTSWLTVGASAARAAAARPRTTAATRWLPVLLIGLPLPLLLLEPPELEIPFVLPHRIEEALRLVPVEPTHLPNPAISQELRLRSPGVLLLRAHTRIHTPILV